MAMLEVLVGDSPPNAYEIVRRETVVGRHPQCDIVLPDTTVSRQHAKIFCEKDGYYIEDLDSQHGTRLNDQAVISREKLCNLDQIRIRSALLKFHEKSSQTFDLESSNDRPSTILSKKDASSVLQRGMSENAQEKLRALLEITRTLGTSLDLQQIFPQILDRVFLIFPQATRGSVVLAETLDDRIVPHAVKDKDDDPSEAPPISRTIADRVIRHGEAILSSDTSEDSRFDKSDSIVNFRIRSIMCAPLVGTSKSPLGMIQIETDGTKPSFTEEDLEVLVNVSNLVGQIIDHSRLHETQLQYDRRARDLEVARQVQLHFLPEQRPRIPGYQVFDYYLAAEGVGGDYFGYIDLPGDRYAIAIGDVAGKGVSAALLMARLCSDVRYCLVTSSDPAEATEQLNRQISNAVFQGGFITFAITILDPATNELTVVNAGHMPPLCRRASSGEVESIGQDVSSPPLGVRSERKFEAAKSKLEPGDTVFLYTDGVSEATNKHRDMFSIPRIEQLVGEAGGAERTVQRVLDHLNQFTSGTSQSDDICMVCLSRDAEPMVQATGSAQSS